MRTPRKGPGRKPPSRPESAEGTDGKAPGERTPPAAAERTEPAQSRPESAPSAPRETTGAEPLTNQDEQEKITNADENDGPIAEK